MSIATKAYVDSQIACINTGTTTPLALNASVGLDNVIGNATGTIALITGDNIHLWNSDGVIDLTLSAGAAIGFAFDELQGVAAIINNATALSNLGAALGFTAFDCSDLAGCSIADLGTKSYSDLTGTPTNVSTFINDSGFITDITITAGTGISVVKNGIADYTITNSVSATSNTYIASFGTPTVVAGAHTVASTYNTAALGPSFTITEVDPTVPAHVKSITTADIINWDAATTNVNTNLLNNDLVQDADRTHNFNSFTNDWNSLGEWNVTSSELITPLTWTFIKESDVQSLYTISAVGTEIKEQNLVAVKDVGIFISTVTNNVLLRDQIADVELGIKDGVVLVQSPAVTATTASNGQALILTDDTTGEVEFQDITLPSNVRTIINDSLALTQDTTGSGGTILIDASSNTVNYQLPNPAAVAVGSVVRLKAIDVTAAASVTVTGGANIDSAATYIFSSQNEAITVQNTGTYWILLS